MRQVEFGSSIDICLFETAGHQFMQLLSGIVRKQMSPQGIFSYLLLCSNYQSPALAR